MIPSAAEILRKRWAVATVIRLSTIVPGFLVAMSLAIWGVMMTVTAADPGEFPEGLHWGVHVLFATIVGVEIGFGVMSWQGAPKFAAKIVPVPVAMHCPKCRYELTGVPERRCPECGIPLTGEFLGEPPEPRLIEPATIRVNKLRELTAVVLRWFASYGVFAGVVGLLVCVSLGSEIMFDIQQGRKSPEEAGLILTIFWVWVAFFCGLMGVSLFCFSRPRFVSRHVVPSVQEETVREEEAAMHAFMQAARAQAAPAVGSTTPDGAALTIGQGVGQ